MGRKTGVRGLLSESMTWRMRQSSSSFTGRRTEYSGIAAIIQSIFIY